MITIISLTVLKLSCFVFVPSHLFLTCSDWSIHLNMSSRPSGNSETLCRIIQLNKGLWSKIMTHTAILDRFILHCADYGCLIVSELVDLSHCLVCRFLNVSCPTCWMKVPPDSFTKTVKWCLAWHLAGCFSIIYPSKPKKKKARPANLSLALPPPAPFTRHIQRVHLHYWGTCATIGGREK